MQTFVPPQLAYMETQLRKIFTGDLAAHAARVDNPHGLTLVQMVALGAATAANLLGHTNRTDNPHSLSLAQMVALGAATAANLNALGISTASNLGAHTIRTDNPHSTTLQQVVPTAASMICGRVACTAETTVALGVDFGTTAYVTVVTPEVTDGSIPTWVVKTKTATSFVVQLSAYPANTFVSWMAVKLV